MTIPVLANHPSLIYYGPHACPTCYQSTGTNAVTPQVLIAKLGTEWGGAAFDYPDGPIYPNTVWVPHVCRP